jgi:hypothetical protein
MNIINNTVAVAAGATVNVLAGDIFQLLRRPSRVRVGVVKQIAGAADLISARFTIGDAIIAEQAQAKTEINAGGGVDVNTDLNIVGVGNTNDSLGLAITNPAGAARTVTFYVLIEPIA